jgi:hypothetical protein
MVSQDNFILERSTVDRNGDLGTKPNKAACGIGVSLQTGASVPFFPFRGSP